MCTLTVARGLRGCLDRATALRAVARPTWLATVPRRRQHHPHSFFPCCTSGSSSSSGGSSNGWLLDAADFPSSSSSSSSSSSNGNGSTHQRGYDAIMVLGGGLLPDGGLPEWVLRRLEGSLYLYQQQREQHAQQQQKHQDKLEQDLLLSSATPAAPSGTNSGTAAWGPAAAVAAATGPCRLLMLGAATPHKPPVLDELGHVLYESTAYASYLMSRGVPAVDLLKETQSSDTVGNGYFSLLMHALPAGWRRIAVVTSHFHMPRTQATFDFIYRLAGTQLYGDPGWYQLQYQAVSDEGIFPQEVIDARAAKEAAAIASWHANTAGMTSLADLHAWLYATHLCYSVSRQHEFGRRAGDLDPKLAATY